MCEQSSATAAVIGARIQRFRIDREISQEDLARGAGISRTTLQKLEAGHSVTAATLKKIADYVKNIEWDFTQPIDDWDRPYRVWATENPTWLVTYNTPDSPRTVADGSPMEDEAERDRMGHLGFVSAFCSRMSCDLREGKLRASLLEIYGPPPRPPFRHPEEEFVYCLRGVVRVTVGNDHVDLKAGQAMTFWSTEPHTYSLPKPLRKTEKPPLLLMVWTEGKAISREESKKRKRKPRTPSSYTHRN